MSVGIFQLECHSTSSSSASLRCQLFHSNFLSLSPHFCHFRRRRRRCCSCCWWWCYCCCFQFVSIRNSPRRVSNDASSFSKRFLVKVRSESWKNVCFFLSSIKFFNMNSHWLKRFHLSTCDRTWCSISDASPPLQQFHLCWLLLPSIVTLPPAIDLNR